MRIKAWVLMVLLSVMLVGCSSNQPELSDSEGHVIKMSDLKGKWVILNYWASWCKSCIEEIPALNEFYQHNKDKNIVLYGVNYDDLPMDTLKESITTVGIEFPVLTRDPGNELHLSELTAVPTTFIIDPNGKSVKMLVGPNTEQSLTQVIKTLQHEAA